MTTRRMRNSGVRVMGVLMVVALLCARGYGADKPARGAGAVQPGAAPACDFTGGPADAKVKVEAYYPGRHEDTLAAVKSLLTTFPGKVRVEIIDWRTPEGLKRRDATGLVCAGVMINGKNAFDLVTDSKPNKVLFVRSMDGEWTKADLEAAVRQELEKVDKAAAK